MLERRCVRDPTIGIALMIGLGGEKDAVEVESAEDAAKRLSEQRCKFLEMVERAGELPTSILAVGHDVK